jgi:hypothetical protein
MKNNVTEGRDKWVEVELTKLRRELEENKYNQPVTIGQTNSAIAGPAVVPNDSYVSATATLVHNRGARVLGVALSSLYKDSVSAANRYPRTSTTGTNWTAEEMYTTWYSGWADLGSSDGYNLKYIQQFTNRSGAPITILFDSASRIIAKAVG